MQQERGTPTPPAFFAELPVKLKMAYSLSCNIAYKTCTGLLGVAQMQNIILPLVENDGMRRKGNQKTRLVAKTGKMHKSRPEFLAGKSLLVQKMFSFSPFRCAIIAS
jgi:hypothetical protein